MSNRTPEETKAYNQAYYKNRSPEKIQADKKRAKLRKAKLCIEFNNLSDEDQKLEIQKRRDYYKSYRLRNLEKVKEKERRRARKKREKDPQPNRDAARKWRAENPDRIKPTSEWRKENPARSKKSNRDLHLRTRFGITFEEWTEKFSGQGERCRICGSIEPKGRYWHTDHCHDTKILRDILCQNCNVGLGHFADDSALLREAASYIDRWNTAIGASA